jgi:predicted Zn-dependent protease
MRRPISFEDVEEFEVTARTPAAHRSAAATLAAWAEESHPDDVEVSPAALLSAAAWHLQEAGDPEEALALHRRSAAAAGDVPPNVRCYLHGALLTAGHLDEARRVADEVRRSGPADVAVYEIIAENYELAGDLKQAHRWLELGAARLDRIDDQVPIGSADDAVALLSARRRVRQALGFPLDELDDLVREPGTFD